MFRCEFVGIVNTSTIDMCSFILTLPVDSGGNV